MMKPSLQLKLGQTADHDPAAAAGHPPPANACAGAAGAHPRTARKQRDARARGRVRSHRPHSKRSNRIRCRKRSASMRRPAPEVAVEAEVIEDTWSERSAGSDSWRDDDERAAEVADDAHALAAGPPGRRSSNTPISRRATSRSRAPSSMRSTTTATSPIRSKTSPPRCCPKSTADADRSRARAAGSCRRSIRPASPRATLGECLALQLRTLHPDTPGLRLALAIADKHLDLLADRELTLLRRELRGLRRGTRAGRRAGARAAIRARAPPSAAPRPSTWCPTCSCAAPIAAGPSK